MTTMTSTAALQRLTMHELRVRYAELFGETTAVKNRTWLLRRVAWRLQSLAEGDLSERARQRATELANDADLRTTVPRAERPAPAPECIQPLPMASRPDPRLPDHCCVTGCIAAAPTTSAQSIRVYMPGSEARRDE